MYSNGTEVNYTEGGVGIPYTNSIMTNSKKAILTGTPGNKEKNHYITYDFKSNTACNGGSFWKTKFAIFCEPNGNKDIDDADFTVVKDDSMCEISISVRHPSGCAMVNLRQVIDFFRNNPILTAIIMIVVGIISTFFGGKWFDEFAGIVGGGVTFIYILLIFSVLGATKALDSRPGSKSFVNIILVILTFAIASGAAFFVFWLCQKNKLIGPAYLAAIIGMYLGFQLYRWTFQMFFDKTIILVVLIIVFAVPMAWYAYFFAFRIILPLTAGLGSLAILWGVSFIVNDAFSKDMSSITKSSNGFSNIFYYVMAFILLFVFGYAYQKSQGFDSPF